MDGAKRSIGRYAGADDHQQHPTSRRRASRACRGRALPGQRGAACACQAGRRIPAFRPGAREVFMIQQVRMILPTMRADFVERVRSYRFLAMLLFSVFLTYFFLPGQGAVFYANLAMGPARPIYSSAAIGSLTAILMAEFFTLFAFYLVKGNIERDRQTRVGQIIATTPISRVTYMLGKWLSNLAIITAMVAGII